MRFSSGQKNAMGLEEWYENPYLQAIHQFGHTGVNPTGAESRINLLYNLLGDNIMPWMWDTDHYMDENKDMYGFFYPEDLSNIIQIKYFEGQRKK